MTRKDGTEQTLPPPPNVSTVTFSVPAHVIVANNFLWPHRHVVDVMLAAGSRLETFAVIVVLPLSGIGRSTTRQEPVYRWF